MAFRLKYQVVLHSGDHFTGATPVQFTKDFKDNRKDAVKKIADQIRDVYKTCQTDNEATGHIRLGDTQYDANDIAALTLVPQFWSWYRGWKDIK